MSYTDDYVLLPTPLARKAGLQVDHFAIRPAAQQQAEERKEEKKEEKKERKELTQAQQALRREILGRMLIQSRNRSRRGRSRRGRGYSDQNANQVFRLTVSDAVGITANGSGNTIGSQGLDPSGWTNFSVYQDMFGKYRIVKAEYRIVTAGANVSTTPQSLVIAFDPAATSITPGSQAVLWQFPKSKAFQLASASGVAADKRTFDFVTKVVPDQEWYDMTTPTVQRGCLGYYGDGATVSVAAWTLYIKYHVEFSGLVTP